MSPLSTPRQQQAFIAEVRQFHRRALLAIGASYLILFLFVIGAVAVYYTQQNQLQHASCTGRLTLRKVLILAERRTLSGLPRHPTAQQQQEARRAAAFYRAAIRDVDVSDCPASDVPPLPPGTV